MDALSITDCAKRVGVEQYKVGALAFRDRSGAFAQTEKLGWGERRRAQRLRRA